MTAPTHPLVEAVARAIYDKMPYYELVGIKPDWVERGNSLKQDEARRYALAAIRTVLEWEPPDGFVFPHGNNCGSNYSGMPKIFHRAINAALLREVGR